MRYDKKSAGFFLSKLDAFVGHKGWSEALKYRIQEQAGAESRRRSGLVHNVRGFVEDSENERMVPGRRSGGFARSFHLQHLGA